MTRAAFALVLQLQLHAAHLQPTAPTCSGAHLQRGHRCEPYAEVCRGSVTEKAEAERDAALTLSSLPDDMAGSP